MANTQQHSNFSLTGILHWLRTRIYNCCHSIRSKARAGSDAPDGITRFRQSKLSRWIRVLIFREDVHPTLYTACVRIPIVFVYFVHPFIALEVLQLFDCDQLGDRSYLNVDYRIDCTSERYRRWRTGSIFFLLFWCVVLPLGALSELYKGKRQQGQQHSSRQRLQVKVALGAAKAATARCSAQRHLVLPSVEALKAKGTLNSKPPAPARMPSKDINPEEVVAEEEADQDIITEHIADYSNPFYFLRQGYNNKRWWWEIVVFSRKLAFSVLVVFLREQPLAQTVWAAFITFAALILQLLCKPHLERRLAHNGTHRGSAAVAHRFMLQQRTARHLRNLEVLSLVLCGFTIIASVFYFEPDIVHTDKEVAVTVFLVLINVGFLAVVLIDALNKLRWRQMHFDFKRSWAHWFDNKSGGLKFLQMSMRSFSSTRWNSCVKCFRSCCRRPAAVAAETDDDDRCCISCCNIGRRRRNSASGERQDDDPAAFGFRPDKLSNQTPLLSGSDEIPMQERKVSSSAAHSRASSSELRQPTQLLVTVEDLSQPHDQPST